jgi:hypothetical protein
MSNVTVLTASIPERASKLAEAIACVTAQTEPPASHLIGIDHAREGAPVVLNELLAAVGTEWVMVLDDDDLLDKNHLEVVTEDCRVGVDVVYSYCRTTGRPYKFYNQPFSVEGLMGRSVVSHTALVRTDLLCAHGGWENTVGYDWELWKGLARAGARFQTVPYVTWTYRLDMDHAHLSWEGWSS